MNSKTLKSLPKNLAPKHPPMPINQLDELEPRWFAVHTRFKSEKYVRDQLLKKDVEAWVPIQEMMRIYNNRPRKVSLPLISCYVFVHILKKDYITVLETEHVAGFVRNAKNLVAVTEHEIHTLKRITMEADLDISVVPDTMQAGDPIVIAQGNLAGMKGTIIEVEGKNKMKVALEQLGLQLLITIDVKFLEKTGFVMPPS